MSRIFWDSMLFIYLVDGHSDFEPIVTQILSRSFRRGDQLFTSHLSLAETLVGIPQGSPKEKILMETLSDMGFRLVSFDAAAVEPFRMLRRQYGLRPPDSMNLACAAATQADIFLTGDTQLLKKHLHVPGIQFIADFRHAPL